MKATKILMDEHRVIERVLSVLEAAVAKAERGEAVRPGMFLEAADFIKDFADGSHHHKEEGVLFEAMAAAGVPREAGPIAVMLSEHEQARAYTRAIREAAQRWERGDTAAVSQVATAARGYAALLRQHIAKEDQILFPMAEQAIPRGKHDSVIEAFDQVEPEAVRASVHAKYVALAEALEREIAS
jgi:hemerythrin-like domain-containing protein